MRESKSSVLDCSISVIKAFYINAIAIHISSEIKCPIPLIQYFNTVSLFIINNLKYTYEYSLLSQLLTIKSDSYLSHFLQILNKSISIGMLLTAILNILSEPCETKKMKVLLINLLIFKHLPKNGFRKPFIKDY